MKIASTFPRSVDRTWHPGAACLALGMIAAVCLGAATVATGQTRENSSHQMATGNFNTADAANEVAFINAVNNWPTAPTAGSVYIHDFNTGFSQVLPGINAIKIVAGDVNGTGPDELVYINSSNQLGYYDFPTSTNTIVDTTPIGGVGFQDITVANIDADAQVEIYTSENPGNGALRFYDAVTNSFTAANGGAGNIIRADLAADAADEVAVRNQANNASGGLFVHFNPPTGGFQAHGGGLNRIAAGDLDPGNAITDEIFLTNSSSATFTKRITDPVNVFKAASGTGTDPTVGHVETFGDGRDLAFLINSGQIRQATTAWNLATGAGMTYTPLRRTASNNGSAAVAGNSSFFDIIAADVDADGLDEIIGRQTTDTGSTLWLFKNGAVSLLQQNVFLTTSDLAGSSSFALAGNWSNALAPQAGINYDVGTARTLRTPSALNPGTFAGDSLNVYTGGTLSLDHTGTATINNLNLDGGTVTHGAGGRTLAGSINLVSDSSMGAGSGNATVTAPISGSGGVTKTGSSVLYVDGNNSYDGVTTVSGGFLVARHANALGSAVGGSVVQNGTTLQLENVSGDVHIASEAVSITGDGFFLGQNRGALASWTGNNSWGGPVTMTGNSSIFVNTGSLAVNGVISDGGGAFNLTKIGNGTLELGGASSNTYTGTTIIDAGTTILNKTGGASAIVGPVQMGAGNANQPNLRMSQNNQFGPGVVMTTANVQGNWTRFDLLGTNQTLAGVQDLLGGLVIQNGGIGVGSATDATLTIDNSADYSLASHVRDHDGTDLGGNLNLVKNGTGRLTLERLPGGAARVTYTGTTTVINGTLELVDLNDTDAPSDVSYNSPTTVNANGTLEINSSVPFVANRWKLTKTLDGDGTFVKTGTGNFYVTGTVSLTGEIHVLEGLFGSDNNASIWSGTTADAYINSGAFLDMRADPMWLDTINDGPDGPGNLINSFGGGTNILTIGVANGDGSFSGNIEGGGSGATGEGNGRIALTKNGTGMQTFSGTNTYGGATTINNGTLAVQNGAAIPDGSNVTINGGDLNIGSTAPADDETIGALTLAGGDVTGGSTLQVSGPITANASGTIGDDGTLDLNGQTVSVTTGGDTLTVTRNIVDTAGNTLNKSGSGTLEIAAGASLTSIVNSAGSMIVTGGLVDLNGGTIDSTGGPFTLAGGTVQDVATFTGNLLQTGGTLRAGDDAVPPDMMDIVGNLTQTGGVIEVKVEGPQDSGLFDVYNVDGDVILDGTLKIISDFNPGTTTATGFFANVIVTTAGHTIMASGLMLDADMAPLTGPPFRTWDFRIVNLPGGGQALQLVVTPGSLLIWMLVAGTGLVLVRRQRRKRAGVEDRGCTAAVPARCD